MTDPQGDRPQPPAGSADTPPYWPYGTPPKPPASLPTLVQVAAPPARTPLRDLGSQPIALMAWAIVLALAGLFFWEANASAPAPAPPEAIAELPPVQPLDSIGRVIVAAAASAPAPPAGAGGAAPANPLLTMAEVFGGDDPASRLRISILHADVEGREAGLAALDKAMKDLPPDSILQPRAEVLRKLFKEGPASLTPAEADGLKKDHEWFGDLALTLGAPETDPAREALLARARTSVTLLLALEVVLFAGAALGGLVCCVLAVIFIVTGSVRPRLAPPAPGGSVFLESFAVFLLGMLALKLAGPFIHAIAGDLAVLAQWAVAPLALYPLLRGVPFTQMRFAMGWHTGRGLFREIAAGICGYLACMPIFLAGIGLTLLLMLLRTAIVGVSETPSHPIGKMLGGAGIGQIIAILALATVWAPLVEESFFRGALYHHLRGRLHWSLAGLLQGVLFAAIHPQGWVAIPALASLGCCFSLLREWRTSLIAPIVAHAINNGAIITLLIVMLNV